jgi:hypothetical protein
LLIVADPVATQASALRLSVSATACWLQIMLRGRLVRENFDDRTAPKPPSLPRRLEIAPHRQDDHIQKRTLFKPNECVVHLQSHELLSSLMDISINPILFISCLVHHEPPGCQNGHSKTDHAQHKSDMLIAQALDIERHLLGRAG